MLRPGDKIQVIDGLGNVIVAEATVERTVNSIVFVRECLTNGRSILYGLPTSACEPVKINTKPTLGEVAWAVRVIFLEEQNGYGGRDHDQENNC